MSFSTNGLFGVNNFTNPPLFANLATGDFHLSAASPCINAGNNSFITNSTDLDGNPRIVGGIVDLGAYEFQALVRYVSVSNTAPVSPFTNWLTAATNIQDAVDVANAGDFIVVSNGTYNAGGRVVSGTMTNRVVIDKAVTVQSVNGSDSTIVAGLPGTGGYLSSGIRCVYLTNGATLIGFTLTNGATRLSGDIVREQSGAAVWCESTNAIISNCTLMHSYANQYGGGAYQGTFNNCTITGDTAFISGGGTYLANLNNCVVTGNKLIQGSGGGGAAYGMLSNCLVVANFAPGYGGGTYYSTLTGCVVSNNSAQFGGGVCYGVVNNCLISSNSTRASGLYGGGAFSNILNNCVLRNNWAQYGGGAYGGMLNSCCISNNSARYGGGMCFGVANNSLTSSNLAGTGGGACSNTLINCVLNNNTAVYDGYVDGAHGGGAYRSVLIGCTVVSNTTQSAPGGAAGGGVYGGALTNCIVYYNTSEWGDNFDDDFAAVISYCDTTPLATNGVANITNEPAFVDLVNSDFHLQSNSPCINSGNNAAAPAGPDLDGNPRIVGGTVDMGAYEYQTPTSIISYAWLQQYGLPTDGSVDSADLDGNGMNVYQDWIAGLNPTNPASVLAMLPPASTNNPAGLVVSWQSVSGITYFLQSSTNLTAQPAFSTVQSNIVGQAGTTSYTDTTATNGGPYFYRVGVQ